MYHVNVDSQGKQNIRNNNPKKKNNHNPSIYNQKQTKPIKTTPEEKETNKLTKPRAIAQPRLNQKQQKKKCNNNKNPKHTHQSPHNKEQKQ